MYFENNDMILMFFIIEIEMNAIMSFGYSAANDNARVS